MALSDNKIVQLKVAPKRAKLKVVDGLIHIYKGANLMYEKANVGYAMLASDRAPNAGGVYDEFAGIAMEELNLAAADNGSDGTFEIEILPRGCGEWVLMDVTSSITIANEGDAVYMDTDEYVDIASGISHSVTNGMVGIIRQFVSTNKAWVQMTQHPIL